MKIKFLVPYQQGGALSQLAVAGAYPGGRCPRCAKKGKGEKEGGKKKKKKERKKEKGKEKEKKKGEGKEKVNKLGENMTPLPRNGNTCDKTYN